MEDPDYLGVRHKRLVGDEYVDAVDELMAALTSRYPNVLIQVFGVLGSGEGGGVGISKADHLNFLMNAYLVSTA